MGDLAEKTERELACARLFLSVARLAAVLHGGDRPDVVLEFQSGDRVGLEVVGLTDPAEKASTSAMDRVQREAERLLAGERAFVAVHWHTGARLDPSRAQVEEIARSLAEAVRTLRARGEDIADRCNGLRSYPELRQVADRVVVLDDAEGPIVTSTTTGWMHGIPHVVQRALDAKEAKLREYRARTGLPQWLLLVTGSDSAQPLVPRMLPRSHTYRSSFDRAFAIDGAWGEVVELQLNRPVDDALSH